MKVLSILFFLLYSWIGFLGGSLLVLGYVALSLVPIERALNGLLMLVSALAFVASLYLLVSSGLTLKKAFNPVRNHHREIRQRLWILFAMSSILALALGALGARTFSGMPYQSILLHMLLQLPLWISLLCAGFELHRVTNKLETG